MCVCSLRVTRRLQRQQCSNDCSNIGGSSDCSSELQCSFPRLKRCCSSEREDGHDSAIGRESVIREGKEEEAGAHLYRDCGLSAQRFSLRLFLPGFLFVARRLPLFRRVTRAAVAPRAASGRRRRHLSPPVSPAAGLTRQSCTKESTQDEPKSAKASRRQQRH